VAGNLIACVVTLPWALGGASAGRVDAAVVGYLGAFQVAGAYLCLLRGVPHLRALEVSLLLASEPVASAVFAWLLHGEVPGATAGLGCAFIFAGALVQALRPGGETRNDGGYEC
jgi:drug/metabolite transporter (DMT)-like permease